MANSLRQGKGLGESESWEDTCKQLFNRQKQVTMRTEKPRGETSFNYREKARQWTHRDKVLGQSNLIKSLGANTATEQLRWTGQAHRTERTSFTSVTFSSCQQVTFSTCQKVTFSSCQQVTLLSLRDSKLLSPLARRLLAALVSKLLSLPGSLCFKVFCQ